MVWRPLLGVAAIVGLSVGVDAHAAVASPPSVASWLIAPTALNNLVKASSDLPMQFFDNASTDFVGPVGGPSAPLGWSGTPVLQASAEGDVGTISANDSCNGVKGVVIPCLQVACNPSLSDCDSPFADSATNWPSYPGIFFDDERWSTTPSLDQTPHDGVCSALSQAVADVKNANQANGTNFQLEVAPDEDLAWPTLEAWLGAESSPWQVDIRNDWPACASDTNRYHIMSQALETTWDNTALGSNQGSESDFDNYVTQTMLQTNAAGIASPALTAGLGATDRYGVTPQELYQDTLDTQASFGASPLVNGYWLNVANKTTQPIALQYLEMLDGTVPLYLQGNTGSEQLTRTFPEGDAAKVETVQPGSANQKTWVDTSDPLPVGTVIPAGAASAGLPAPDDGYRVQLFCADSASICHSARVNVIVGICVVSGGVCTSNRTKLAEVRRETLWGATQYAFGSEELLTPVSASVTTVATPHESFYVTVQNDSSTTPVDLFDDGDNCTQACPSYPPDVPAAVAVPRPSTPSPSGWSAVTNSSVLVPTTGGRLTVGLPAYRGGRDTVDLAHPGSAVYQSSWTVTSGQGPVTVLAGAALLQTTATDDNPGHSDSAVVAVAVGYCTSGVCTWPNGNGTNVTVTPGTAQAAADGSGAFTMQGFTIPVGAHLALQISVQRPGAVTLDLGGTEPTNLASSYVGPVR